MIPPAGGSLVIIRHGLTEANRQEWLMGHQHDLPLLPESRRVARRAAATPAFATLAQQASCVWTSPLRRARQTASILAHPYGLEVRAVYGLIERDFGAYAGRPFSELAGDTDWQAVDRESHARPPGGGESLRDVECRVFATVLALHQSTPPVEHLLLVTHSVPFRLVNAALAGRRRFPLTEPIPPPLHLACYARTRLPQLAALLEAEP